MKISRKVFWIFFTIILVTLVLAINQGVSFYVQQRFYTAVSTINQLQIQVRKLDQLRLAILLPDRQFDRQQYDHLADASSKTSSELKEQVVMMPPNILDQLENMDFNLSNFRRSLLELAGIRATIKQLETLIHDRFQNLHTHNKPDKEHAIEHTQGNMYQIKNTLTGAAVADLELLSQMSSFVHHLQFQRLPKIKQRISLLKEQNDDQILAADLEMLLQLLENYYLSNLQLFDRKKFVETSANIFLEQTQYLLTQLEEIGLQRQRLVSQVSLVISFAGLLVAIIYWYWIKIYLRRFLFNQKQVMQTIQNGSQPLQLAPQSNDELGDLTKAMKALAIDLNSKKADLLASEQKFRSLVENLSDWIWEIDTHFRFTYCSKVGEDITGYSGGEILGENYLTFITDYDEPEVLDLIENYLDERLAFTNIERKIRHKDGSIRYLMVSATPLFNDVGKFVGFRGVDHDVTELKTSQQAREQLEINLQHSQKMESIGRLAGGVAHDFNNILSAILGYSELTLELLNKDHNCYNFVDQIRVSGERAAGLTNQLLAFSRKQPHTLQVLNLVEEFDGLEDMLRRLVGEQIKLQFGIEEDIWPVQMDKSQLEQVVTNLIVNAKDAMPEGGEIGISLNNCPLDCSCRTADGLSRVPQDCVEIRVDDNGCGIPENVIPKIFDPFFTTKDPDKGTGLGLAMVYGIIKQNNGDVQVDSKLGEGTSFRVYLPRSKRGTNPQVVEDTQQELRMGSETILFVEDEDQLLTMHSEFLTSLGYHLLTASDGHDALEKFNYEETKIDLLITDVVMPNLGGIELSEKLKKLDPALKVLYTSGYTRREHVTDDILQEGRNFIYKPATPHAIARMIGKLLDEN